MQTFAFRNNPEGRRDVKDTVPPHIIIHMGRSEKQRQPKGNLDIADPSNYLAPKNLCLQG
jgi:hypothetical protein